MYKYKLKEIEVGDTDIRKGVKTTVSDVDPETGAITYDVENVADFSSTYKELEQAKKFLRDLEQTGKAKDDTTLDKLADELSSIFNKFRTHIRKNYPEEYERVLRLKEEEVLKDVENIERYLPKINNKVEWGELLGKILNLEVPQVTDIYKKQFLLKIVKQLKEEEIDEQSSTAQGGMALSGGVGAQYATPRAFSKNKKGKGAASIYYYKLGYKPVPKIKPKSYDIKKLFEYNDFQQNRISVFDDIEKKIDMILPMLSNAKNKTAEYYNENPGSYAINYPTDAILVELDDIIKQLKAGDENIIKSV